MLEFQDQFTRYRVDNPDGDNLWDTGDLNGNGEIDHGEVVGPLVDFDQVHNTRRNYGSASVRNNAQMQGVQLARALRFSKHEDVKETNQTRHFLELSSGARYFRLRDRFLYANTFGFLGEFITDTSMENVSFGPQLGLRWGSSNRNWDFDAEGIFLLGHNRIDGTQTGQIGNFLIPGQLNHPLSLSPTTFSGQQDDEDFSPIGEVRASASYQLTETLAVRLGYSAFYVGNLQYAEDAVVWRLPDMGIAVVPEQDWFTETLCANIELLR